MTNQLRESGMGTCVRHPLGQYGFHPQHPDCGDGWHPYESGVADPPKVSETRTLEPNQDLSSVPKATGNSVIGASQDSIVADRPGAQQVADGFTKEMKAWRCSCGAETGSVKEPSFCSYCGRGFVKQGAGAQDEREMFEKYAQGKFFLANYGSASGYRYQSEETRNAYEIFKAGRASVAQPSSPVNADTLMGIYCGGRAEQVLKDFGKVDWEAWQRVADYVNAAVQPSPVSEPCRVVYTDCFGVEFYCRLTQDHESHVGNFGSTEVRWPADTGKVKEG